MKILHMEQGSVEWMLARLGKPTASHFDELLTPKTRKPSASARKYHARLLGEWLIGQPADWASSGFMERGTELEDEARKFYAMEKDTDVETVGFVLRDDELVGCSPDGLVGADGGLEIKCPGLVQHALYMLGEPLPHTGQVQGCMYLAEREWWDVMSYHPSLPSVIQRVERDGEYIAALLPTLEAFLRDLEASKETFARYRNLHPMSPDFLAELETRRGLHGA
jgi:hypothetical protein